MGAKPHDSISSFVGVVLLLLIGALPLQSCSTPSVSKPEEGLTAGRPEVPTAGQPRATRPQPTPPSSLEAYQRETLGKEAELGPLRDVNFDFDRYDLRPDAREILKKHATWLKANPQARVQIEGHCDERGTNEYNLALGAKRAESVKLFLVALGISPGRLSTISYGEELPLCKEQNEACWGRNRRAHFIIRTGLVG